MLFKNFRPLLYFLHFLNSCRATPVVTVQRLVVTAQRLVVMEQQPVVTALPAAQVGVPATANSSSSTQETKLGVGTIGERETTSQQQQQRILYCTFVS